MKREDEDRRRFPSFPEFSGGAEPSADDLVTRAEFHTLPETMKSHAAATPAPRAALYSATSRSHPSSTLNAPDEPILDGFQILEMVIFRPASYPMGHVVDFNIHMDLLGLSSFPLLKKTQIPNSLFPSVSFLAWPQLSLARPSAVAPPGGCVLRLPMTAHLHCRCRCSCRRRTEIETSSELSVVSSAADRRTEIE
ncbi:hypothetical protein ACLOJK_037698 [Asimina triloba]